MNVAESAFRPPRWAAGLLLLALPCDPMREAILGDLHEEFLDDIAERGGRSARARYVQRTASIVVRALTDAMIRRQWVSTGPVATQQLAAEGSRSNAQRRASAAGGFAVLVVVALIVLALAVVVNTILFSANAARQTHVSSVAGVGGIALLVACVGFGAIVVCAGPRWRRNRRRGA